MRRNPPHNPETRDALADRRREARIPASGAGWFEPAEDAARESFRLLDRSPGGFRARHHCPTLCAGQTVRFHHPFAEGTAVVIWNRVLGDDVESGLLIVSRPL